MKELLIAALGRIEQPPQGGATIEQPVDPTFLPLFPFRVGGIVSPCSQEGLDQRFDRLRAGLERKEAPAAAVFEGRGQVPPPARSGHA